MPASVPALQLDPAKPHHITIVGRKGTGKTELARRFWNTYPNDRLLVDPTGDLRDAAPRGEGVHDLTVPIPARWPITTADGRDTLYFKPDYLSPTYADDLDRCVGLAFTHGHCLVWVDEGGELTSANKTGPHTRRTLHQSRHQRLSMLFCQPRPIDINPLVLSQADYVAAFDLPNPADRKRVADTIGWDPDEFDEAMAQLERYGFLWHDAREHELTIMPPLPAKPTWPVQHA